MDNEAKTRKGISAKRVIWTSFLVDFIDVSLNLVVAVYSGSIVMMSEFLEGLADLVASVFLLIGFYRSKKTPDKTHPFGYGREIYFWSLMSALVMFGITATFSFYLGWERFNNPKEISNIWLVYITLVIGLLTNSYAFILSFKRLLRKRPLSHILKIFYNSSLVETKTTFILDLMGASAAFLGLVSLLIYKFSGNPRFDGVGAMTIGVTLACFSYFLILGIRDLMIGKSASEEVEKLIKNYALEVPEVNDVLDLKTMHIGSEKLLVNMEVNMSSKLTTKQLEERIDQIKEKISKEIPSVKHIQVELETED
jgi:cation diffusion facilitator family transporter